MARVEDDLSSAPEAGCNVECPDDDDALCGGPDGSNVVSAYLTDVAPDLSTYVGCLEDYNDVWTSRRMNLVDDFNATLEAEMTYELCASLAAAQSASVWAVESKN